jgi:Cytochrome c7 and related cytochrome c
VARRMGRIAHAVGLPVVAAMCLLGPGLSARQTATQAPARSQPQINVSEYRNRAVPPDPANPPGPTQPIPFSHKLHLSIGLQCSDCHQNPDPGVLMTFPTTAKCMSCHKTIAVNLPAIKKLTAYAKSGKPIPWVRVYVLLQGVNYTHRKHLDAGIQCETCHGPVTQMAVMHQATGITAMSVCLKCHMMNNAPTTCQTCHSWPKINAKGEPAVNP